jgi:hypothetical protein
LDAATDTELFALLLFASVQSHRLTSEKTVNSDNQSPKINQIHDFCLLSNPSRRQRWEIGSIEKYSKRN